MGYRQGHSTAAPAGEQVVVLDNGGGSCKLGLASQPASVKVFPNCTARPGGGKQLVGPQLLEAANVLGLTVRRPIERGYLTNPDLQADIWGHALRQLRVRPKEASLVLTEPPMPLQPIQELTDQLVFEDMGFRSYAALPAPALAVRHWAAAEGDGTNITAARATAGVVLDAGFSFTHAAPVFDGRVLPSGVRRINLGGKALSNYLKELVSYRSMNMREEFVLMEHVKEALCFVSADVRADLAAAARRDSPHRREYVLPDGVKNLRGYVRDPKATANRNEAAEGTEQVLTVNNERFMVPEALFHPSDIGMDQAGVAETVVRAVEGVHPDLHGLMYSNVLLTGGMGRCPGFRDRLEAELRPLVPEQYPLTIRQAEDPITAPWQGGVLFANSPAFRKQAITKHEYEEQGTHRLHYHDVPN